MQPEHEQALRDAGFQKRDGLWYYSCGVQLGSPIKSVDDVKHMIAQLRMQQKFVLDHFNRQMKQLETELKKKSKK
jgi:hypothetical protein